MNNFIERLEQGKLLINNNIDEALILFENLNKEFPNKEDILFELGKIYYIKQNFVKAKTILEQIKNKKNYHLISLLAKIYKSLNINFSALKNFLTLYAKSKNTEIEKEIVNLFLINKKDYLAIKFLLKNNSKNNELTNIMKYYINDIVKEVANNNFKKVKGEIVKIKKLLEKYTADTEYLKEKNILLNEYEIGNKSVFLQSKPRNLIVTLTNKCNLKCRMCRNVLEKPFEISYDYFVEIKELIPYLQRIVWLGGEVFLYNKFFELFEFANFYKIKQNISTNAILLTEEIILKLIKSFDLELNLSIDSITKNIYENIRIGAKFEKLISNLEMLNKFINNRTNIKLCLNVVVSKWNIKENFLNYIDFCKKYNFKQICFTLDTEEKDSKEIINNFNTKYRKKLEEQLKEIKIEVVFLMPFSDKYITDNKINLKQTCLQPWKTMMIDCNDIKFADLCYELYKGTDKTLKYLWNSPKAVEFRKQMLLYSNTRCRNICKQNILDFQRFKT